MSAHECQHTDCAQLVEADARFCERHLEDLRLLFSMVEVRCERCGLLAPEGLLRHDCDHPAEQPHESER